MTGGPVTFTLSPPVRFADNDTVTVTVFAAQVTDPATCTLHPTAPFAPCIVTQPVAKTVAAGSAVSFSVVATGTAPLSYQSGYVAGGTVTIVNTLGYGGTLAGYGWQLLLPGGDRMRAAVATRRIRRRRWARKR